jgi:hypothetical protein
MTMGGKPPSTGRVPVLDRPRFSEPPGSGRVVVPTTAPAGPDLAFRRLIAGNLLANLLLVLVITAAPSLTYGPTVSLLQLAACTGVAINMLYALIRLRALLFG